jgi:tetratricopeptide (TPR) repeat protein
MGLHPGPDLTVAAAASLAGVPVERLRPMLDELTRAHLVEEHARGRFRFHDLLRWYAAQLAREVEPDDERRAVVHRALDHYLHTAHAGSLRLEPHRLPIPLVPARPQVTPERLGDPAAALAWFTAEHQVLLAAVDQAATTGFETHAWQLSWTLVEYLNRRGHWHDWLRTQQTALDVARHLADRRAQALTHRGIGFAHARLGQHTEARTHCEHALALCHELGDRAGAAHAHLTLGGMQAQQGRHQEALDHAAQAVELFGVAGERVQQARALNSLGWAHTQLGEHEQALAHGRQALTLLEEAGERQGQAATWDTLGFAHHRLGDHSEAARCYERAIELFRDVGDRVHEADTLAHLGDACTADGDHDAARDAWQQALTILVELDHPDAEQVRARLTSY